MKIRKCRICGGTHFESIINLGYQKLTGVFPSEDQDVEGGELHLLKCVEEGGCGLVQLENSVELKKMYGENYGYRSGLNKSMVDHLRDVVKYAISKISLIEGDTVVDIGSNDGTLLRLYKDNCNINLRRIGVDPTGIKFKKYYDSEAILIPGFFNANIIKNVGAKKVKIVTSIAMFYDLEEPIKFAQQINEIMDDNGIWISEQSYYPLMIDTCSYDTICHEHLEYYSLKQMEWIARSAGLRIIDVELNDINGGSFRVTFCKESASFTAEQSVISLINDEQQKGVNDIAYTYDFIERIEKNKERLIAFLKKEKEKGNLVLGYGASTKGNVVLQYCGINRDLIPAIAEVNSDKYGRVTPGTMIPIISENEARNMQPKYMLVLPWHFKLNIIKKEAEYIKHTGCKFVFAFPEFEIIGSEMVDRV